MQVRVIEYSCQSWSYGVYALYVWVYLSLSCEFLMRLLCLIHRHAFILLCMLAHLVPVANMCCSIAGCNLYLTQRITAWFNLTLRLWAYLLAYYLRIKHYCTSFAMSWNVFSLRYQCITPLIFFYCSLFTPPSCLLVYYLQRCIRCDRLVVAARQRTPQVCLPCVCHTSCYLLVVATLTNDVFMHSARIVIKFSVVFISSRIVAR